MYYSEKVCKGVLLELWFNWLKYVVFYKIFGVYEVFGFCIVEVLIGLKDFFICFLIELFMYVMVIVEKFFFWIIDYDKVVC